MDAKNTLNISESPGKDNKVLASLEDCRTPSGGA